MNRKKLGSSLIALALVGLVGIGGSLAWFTDNEERSNELNLGHIDITLTEDKWTGDHSNALPGDVYAKNPTIKLSANSQAAWVRIQPLVVNVDFNKDGQVDTSYSLDNQENLSLFGITINQHWVLASDGYFYYESTLNPDESTNALFDSILIPYSWDNRFANAKVTLDITAEAVQRDHTGDSAIDAFATVGSENIIQYTDSSTISE